MNSVILLLCFGLIVPLKIVISHSGLKVGDKCVMDKTGFSGFCLFAEDCSSIITRKWHQDSAYPTLCDIQNNKKIVCCPRSVEFSTIDRHSIPGSFDMLAMKKCSEYQKSCSSDFSIDFKSDTAKSKEFSHAAAIGFPHIPEFPVWRCAGTLISEKFVLSSAYCLRNAQAGSRPQFVRLGDLDLKPFANDPHIMQFNISNIFYHRYIALVKIDGSVSFNDFRPACLAQSMPKRDDWIVVHSWVVYQYTQANNPLEKFRWNSIPVAECYNESENENNETRFCARHVVDEFCHSYTIASMLSTTSNTSCLHEVTAVASNDTDCQSKFTLCNSVSPYLNWIEDIVWMGGDGKKYWPYYRSAEKCKEYANAYRTAERSSIPPRIALRIHNGTSVDPNEFPHMARVGYDGKGTILWSCGGTLISEQFVLTAGHCLREYLIGPAKYIQFGDSAKFNIVQRIQYPNYNFSQNYNDIALLRLNGSVTLNERCHPACLPAFDIDDFNATVTGWGQTYYNGPVSEELLKVDVQSLDYQNCSKFYQTYRNDRLNKGIMNDTQLCTKPINDSGETCRGDSGGPLQARHHFFENIYTVFAINSFGDKCGDKNPSVKTRVFPYLKWIEDHVWPSSIN